MKATKRKSEVWKPVKGFEDRYKISSWGNVISINGKYKGERLLSPCIDAEGYRSMYLSSRGQVRVHVIVGENFLVKPNIPNACVNHKYGDKLNNYYEDLEWTDLKGNNAHAVETGLHNLKGDNHPCRKLNSGQVFDIKFKFPEMDNRKLAKKFHVSREQIRDIRLNKNWKHITKDYIPNNSNSFSLG